MPKLLWYQCPCGYETPISTGMMIHLSTYKGKIHRYKQAIYKTKSEDGNA